jgi:hypothetical protein
VRKAILAVVVLMVARAAAATDVELRLETTLQYDDNILSAADDELGDFSTRLTPRIRVLDEKGSLSYELRYAPRYRRYFRFHEFDGWDQDAYGKVQWRPSERTQLRLSNWYTDLASFERLLSEEVRQDGTIDTGFDLGQQRSKDNRLEAGISHLFTRRNWAELSLYRTDTEWDRADEAKTEVTTINLSYLYTWDTNDQVGLVGRVTRQTVQSFSTLGDPLDTDYYNISLQWVHRFDPTWTLSAIAGPTQVESELLPTPDTLTRPLFPIITSPLGFSGPVVASTCPVLPSTGEFLLSVVCQPIPIFLFPDASFLSEVGSVPLLGSAPDTSEEVTYFATVSLVKQWENYSVSLRYLRDASTSSDVSGTIRDVVSIGGTWDPTERLRIQANAFYEIRESSSQGRAAVIVVEGVQVGNIPGVGRAVGFRLQEFDSVTESHRIFLNLYAEYSVTRNTAIFASAFWSNEEIREDDQALRETDRFGVWLGVRYTLPRFQLPI